MRHFVNQEMLAPNVLEVAVDENIVSEFLPLVASAPLSTYTEVRPPWASDIRWISPTSEETFEVFESAFRRMGIGDYVKQYLDIQEEVAFYAGFIVLRSECDQPNFHRDWELTNNEAFTLITPITSNAEEFGLLFRKMNGDIGEYVYQRGKALILGDHFVHSTKPGRADDPVALLSFTFGTDKMEHWDKIWRTAGYQSRLVKRPDGEFVTVDRYGPSA